MINRISIFEKRGIPVPQNEFVIRGSQEAFIESVRTHIANATSILIYCPN